MLYSVFFFKDSKNIPKEQSLKNPTEAMYNSMK